MLLVFISCHKRGWLAFVVTPGRVQRDKKMKGKTLHYIASMKKCTCAVSALLQGSYN
jgi:hypothetical protein